MNFGLVTGRAVHFMCEGPLCFHGFNWNDKAMVKRGEGGTSRYVCLEWAEMIPN